MKFPIGARQTIRPKWLLARLMIAGLLLVPLSSAAAETPPNYATDTLTGDWGGARGAMFRHGLALDIGVKTDLLRNLSGGIARGGQPMMYLDTKLSFDFDKLNRWAGLTGCFDLLGDAGTGVNQHQVGSLMGVSNIEVPVDTWRVFQAWLQQSFADGRGEMLVGLYPIDTEFQVLDSAALFVQPPYGASADLASTRGPSIFNNSAFGFRGKWYSADRAAYVQGALLDGMPGDPMNPRGTHIEFQKGDGTFTIIEIGLKPGDARVDIPGKKPAAAASDQRIEKYATGLWRYTARVPDQFASNPDGTPIKRLSWGWYALMEKTLIQGPGGREVSGFLRISGTDGDSTAIKHVINVGIQFMGPFPGRCDDEFGLAYSHASLSDQWRSAQLATGSLTNAFEGAWEASYLISLSHWLSVQPVIQHIVHPGGFSARAAANVVGARISIAL